MFMICVLQNQTEDSLRQELTALQEDKYNYETTAKVHTCKSQLC